jgi:type II secretion system protein I
VRRTIPEKEQGFGLVETLVAVAIMALMASLTFAVIATNAQATRLVEDRRLAAMVAQSVIDQVAVGGPQAGESAGLAWRATVEPYSGDAARGGLPLDQITVSVGLPGAPTPLLRLKTLRVRP